MKKSSQTKVIIFALATASALAVPALAGHFRWNVALLDGHTFSCPDGYTKCFLEIWKDGRLQGRRLLKPNQTVDVKLFGLNFTNSTGPWNATETRNKTVVTCANVTGVCVPKASLIRCETEYFRTDDCRPSEKCCVPVFFP